MGRLLLIAVLALGIFAMHTLGHPGEGSSGGAHGGGAMAHGSAHGSGPAQGVGGQHTGPHAGMAPEPVAAPVYGVTTPDEPGEGMDMAGLCLAVLSVWALAGLMWAVLQRLYGRPLSLLAYAVVAHRPNPPPRPPTLAQLSILRI